MRRARALLLTMPDVFPWVRHLSTEEVRAFTVELADALSDAAELDSDANARIKADPAQYEDSLKPTSGDFGQPAYPAELGSPITRRPSTTATSTHWPPCWSERVLFRHRSVGRSTTLTHSPEWCG
jgi:hypothetical protein